MHLLCALACLYLCILVDENVVFKYVCNLHMIRKMYVGCDGLCIGFRLCDWLHEHILMRASDRTTRGFCLCDYPVYAKENICHAFHSCVPRCMSV